METKTIKCSNVKNKKGKFGPSLQIGFKPSDDEEWENYFVNDEALFSYFEKGKSVTIEYEDKNGWLVVSGVSEAAKPVASGGNGSHSSAPVDDTARQDSIQKQVVVKAAAEVHAGTAMPADLFSAWVNDAYAAIFGSPLDAMKKKAQETLDADPDDDEPPF